MLTSKTRKPCPSAANTRSRANNRKREVDITPGWWIREIAAAISIGLLVSIMLWSSILGMSGNMGPGKDVVVGPVAEVDHDGR
jgi:hypothetical protein